MMKRLAEELNRIANLIQATEEKGSGGLLFNLSKHNLSIQTEPKDPHGQVYDVLLLMGPSGGGSGKMAYKKAMEIYEKNKRKIQSLRKLYDVRNFFTDEIKKSGVRGSLRWHQYSMPD
jgi:hypothetical protein